MIFAGSTFVPNRREAIPATTLLLSSAEPSEAMVADVPTHRKVWIQALTYASDQHRHVRTLSPAISVKFIKDKKAKSFSLFDNYRVWKILPRHNQFEHDVVGKQNIRWALRQLLPQLLAFLAGIARVGDGLVALSIAIGEELLKFLQLAVAKRVHRINDDRADALAGIALSTPAQDIINDRNEVRE
jgi:hypothetical protein